MKELNEGTDAMLANTERMAELLRQAITSTYSVGGPLAITLFPNRQSNVPDQQRQATLGIVNPDFWNWKEALDSSTRMPASDLLEMHRHSSNDNGNAMRQYPNNALLLVADDRDLRSIRRSLATMEAADHLLQDQSRSLPEHRRVMLEATRASAQKNATVGIQNKWTHLFSAGNSSQHQWPEPNSHLEHRPLESITDAAGRGQTAWSRIDIIATRAGSTLGELHQYFARTPAERIVANETTWCVMIDNAMKEDALHIVTASGETNPIGRYDANWQVWTKGSEPKHFDWSRIDVITTETGSTLGELRRYLTDTFRDPMVIEISHDDAWCTMIDQAVKDNALHIITTSWEINPTGPYDDRWWVWAKGREPKDIDWRSIGILKAGGSTLDELRQHFSSTPYARIIASEDAWQALIDRTVKDESLSLVDEGGEIHTVGPYRYNWRVQVKGGGPVKKFCTDLMSGREACRALEHFMNDRQYDWEDIMTCQVMGSSPTLADQITSIAQGDDAGIDITMKADTEGLRIVIDNRPPSVFKELSAPMKRILDRVNITDVDLTITLSSAAVPRILPKLSSQQETLICATFR